MIKKKAQINQVFVYIFSIIIILFAGFLVSKFIFTFSDDVEKRAESKFYTDFEQNYYAVYTTYGSEKIFNYKVSSDVEYVCFIQKSDCIASLNIYDNVANIDSSTITALYDAGDRILMFDKDDIINSNKPKYGFELNQGCICIKPNAGRFELIMSNIRNKVYIQENQN